RAEKARLARAGATHDGNALTCGNVVRKVLKNERQTRAVAHANVVKLDLTLLGPGRSGRVGRGERGFLVEPGTIVVQTLGGVHRVFGLGKLTNHPLNHADDLENV